MSRLFLLPLLLCLLWWGFLRYNGIPLAQGKNGFLWILGIGAGLAGFLSLMLYLTSG